MDILQYASVFRWFTNMAYVPQIYIRYVLQKLIDVLRVFFGVLHDVSLNEAVPFVWTVESTVTTVYIVNKLEGFSNHAYYRQEYRLTV